MIYDYIRAGMGGSIGKIEVANVFKLIRYLGNINTAVIVGANAATLVLPQHVKDKLELKNSRYEIKIYE